MKNPQRYALALLFVLLAANFVMAQSVLRPPFLLETEVQTATVQRPQWLTAGARPVGGAVVTGNGINYNGGPVLKSSPVPIYIIWYGTWNGTGSNTAATVSLLQGFLWSTSLGGSSYEAINTTYGDTTGNVSGHLNFVQADL